MFNCRLSLTCVDFFKRKCSVDDPMRDDFIETRNREHPEHVLTTYPL